MPASFLTRIGHYLHLFAQGHIITCLLLLQYLPIEACCVGFNTLSLISLPFLSTEACWAGYDTWILSSLPCLPTEACWAG